MSYILITPVKNEEGNLPLLAECVTNQTILPRVWIIIDGSSHDNTLEIVKKLNNKFEWIYWKIQKNTFLNSGHLNFAWAVKEGYEYAKEICASKKWDYEYVGKIDADVLLPENYFEKLIDECDRCPSIGVISGVPYTLKISVQKKNYMQIHEKDIDMDDFLPDELPDKRLFRKRCLDDIGGFPICKYSPDSVMLVRTRLSGWGIKYYEGLKIYNLRKDTGTERRIWSAFKQIGRSKYYLGYCPALFFLSATNELRKRPHYHVIPFILGYIFSYLRRDERIEDQKIICYFRNRRMKEILNNSIGIYIKKMISN